MMRATLLMLLLLIAACGSSGPGRDEIKHAPMRELFPPLMRGEAAPDASSAEKTETPAARAEQAKAPELTRWPLVISTADVTFQVYEPVVDAWRDNRLTFHALIIARAGRQKPALGSAVMTAQTEGDRGDGIVGLRALEVADAAFQTQAMTNAWGGMLRKALPQNIRTLQRSRLEFGLSIVQARERAAAAATIEVPHIVISQRPAVLVYIDGDSEGLHLPYRMRA